MGGKPAVALSAAIRRALEALAPVLELHRGKSAVIGGLAVIARGIPRLTRDVDVTFSESSPPTLAADLARAGIVPRIHDALEFALESQVLLVRHAESGIDIDVSLASLPFELEAIASAGHALLGATVLPIVQPEDLVIYKAIAWRPQDQQDVERLLLLHGAAMDLSRVRRHVRELGAAMDEDRITALDALIARTLSG